MAVDLAMQRQCRSTRQNGSPWTCGIDPARGAAWTSSCTSASVVAGNTSTPALAKPTGALTAIPFKREPDCCVNLAGIGGGLTARNSGAFDALTTKPRESGLFSELLKTRSLAIRPWRFACFLGHVHKVGNRPLKHTKPESTLNMKAINHEEIYQL